MQTFLPIGPNKVEIKKVDPSDQYIFTNWTVNGTYEVFTVSIEAAGLKKDVYNTTDHQYDFMGLKAGVNYTITIITLSAKPGLTSDPVIISRYTSKEYYLYCFYTTVPSALYCSLDFINKTNSAYTRSTYSSSMGNCHHS